MSSPKRLVLLDGHALLFRAFHAMPHFTSPDGRPTGGVYGFTNVLLRVLRELAPSWIAAVFDTAGPTFRDEIYTAYKATRSETPADLIAQEPILNHVLDALGVPHYRQPGFEADDLIATFTTQALAQADVDEVIVVTGDKDLLQLSAPRVLIYLLRNGSKDIVLLDQAAVTDLMGLPPAQLLDWKALRGDPSDNIVGVPGIGDKTALKLIAQHGNLEVLYQLLDERPEEIVLSDRLKNSLRDHRIRAFDNRALMTVRTDIAVTLDFETAAVANHRSGAARDVLAELGFKGILDRLPVDPNQQKLF